MEGCFRFRDQPADLCVCVFSTCLSQPTVPYRKSFLILGHFQVCLLYLDSPSGFWDS